MKTPLFPRFTRDSRSRWSRTLLGVAAVGLTLGAALTARAGSTVYNSYTILKMGEANQVVFAVHHGDYGIDTQSPTISEDDLTRVCAGSLDIDTTQVGEWFGAQDPDAQEGLYSSLEPLCP